MHFLILDSSHWFNLPVGVSEAAKTPAVGKYLNPGEPLKPSDAYMRR